MNVSKNRKSIKVILLLKDIHHDPFFYQLSQNSSDTEQLKQNILNKYKPISGILDGRVEGEKLLLVWIPDQIDEEAEINHREAMRFVKNKDYDNAILKWEEAIKLNPKDPEYFYKLGLIYFEMKSYKNSISFLERSVQLCPIQHKALLLLGINYIKLRQFDMAENYLTESQRLDKNNVLTYLNLGGVYSVQKKFNEVIEVFNTAVQLNPKEARAYLGLARVYSLLNDTEAANRNFKKVIELAPGSKMSEFAKQSITQPQKDNRLVIDVQENREAFISKGLIHYINGEYRKSAKSYKEYLNLQPKDDYVWYLLGETTLRLSLVSESADCFKRAIRINSKRVIYYRALAIVFHYLGKADETIQILKNIFAMGNKSSFYLTLYGIALMRLNRYDEAINYLKQAVSKDPNNYFARYHLSVGYVHQKDTKNAESNIKYIMSKDLDIPARNTAIKLKESMEEG